MPKPKIFAVNRERLQQSAFPLHPFESPRSLQNARLDFSSFMPPGTRYARNESGIDFNSFFGRGIDEWIFLALSAFKATLLSGARQTSTVCVYAQQLKHFFIFLLSDLRGSPNFMPQDLSPAKVDLYAQWIQRRGKGLGWDVDYRRRIFGGFKATIISMCEGGFIQGFGNDYFRRNQMPKGGSTSKHTSLSVAEQERFSSAIKADLVAIHHDRLKLNSSDVQCLRFLVVGHRQGLNLTPLLEASRAGIFPGALPGTMRLRTVKHRNGRIRLTQGRAATAQKHTDDDDDDGDDLMFDLSEGAVLGLAIKETEHLVSNAPHWCRGRIWLYQKASNGKSFEISCLTAATLAIGIKRLVTRHQLLGDDGRPMRLNLSRLRKSYYERALRINDGDQTKTASFMGNTVGVTVNFYPSMNDAAKAEAAEFMNFDYLDLMRVKIDVQSQTQVPTDDRVNGLNKYPKTSTPVAACGDSLSGELAPNDGKTHCSQFLMCFFCASIAIVGEPKELWRLFSFQKFAQIELDHLNSVIKSNPKPNQYLINLRDRYRSVVPHIDNFTTKQFSSRVIREARAMTELELHPLWRHQIKVNLRGRGRFNT